MDGWRNVFTGVLQLCDEPKGLESGRRKISIALILVTSPARSLICLLTTTG